MKAGGTSTSLSGSDRDTQGGFQNSAAAQNINPSCIHVDENAMTLDEIARLVAHRSVIDVAIAEQVALARTANVRTRYRSWRGLTWAEIGQALGTSGQAAQQRFGHKS